MPAGWLIVKQGEDNNYFNYYYNRLLIGQIEIKNWDTMGVGESYNDKSEYTRSQLECCSVLKSIGFVCVHREVKSRCKVSKKPLELIFYCD